MSNHYHTLERDLRRVLAEISSQFEQGEVEELKLYLDAGEFGLVLETVCTIMKRNGNPISAKIYVELEDLGERMDIDPNCWKHLEVE